jgi:hypothetical protein
MKTVGVVIILATLYAIFFQLSPYIGIPEKIIVVLFILSPFVVIYMVYVVLKYGKPPGKTFDERFYEDYDHTRIREESGA